MLRWREFQASWKSLGAPKRGAQFVVMTKWIGPSILLISILSFTFSFTSQQHNHKRRQFRRRTIFVLTTHKCKTPTLFAILGLKAHLSPLDVDPPDSFRPAPLEPRISQLFWSRMRFYRRVLSEESVIMMARYLLRVVGIAFSFQYIACAFWSAISKSRLFCVYKASCTAIPKCYLHIIMRRCSSLNPSCSFSYCQYHTEPREF